MASGASHDCLQGKEKSRSVVPTTTALLGNVQGIGGHRTLLVGSVGERPIGAFKKDMPFNRGRRNVLLRSHVVSSDILDAVAVRARLLTQSPGPNSERSTHRPSGRRAFGFLTLIQVLDGRRGAN